MFSYVIKYKQGKKNVVAGALLRRYTLINSMNTRLLGFDHIKNLYASDSDFCNVYKAYEKVAFEKFYRYEGQLFRENKLCIPQYSLRELLMREAHRVV